MSYQENRVLNPRAHFNAEDWWYYYRLTDATWERETSPPVALPDGADACFHFRLDGATDYIESFPATMGPADYPEHVLPWDGFVYISASSLLPASQSPTRTLELRFYDQYNAQTGVTVSDFLPASQADEWQEVISDAIPVPEDATYLKLRLGLSDAGVADWYLTKLRISAMGTDGYKDGDSDGWEWAWPIAPHDCISWSTTPIELIGANVLINGGACVVFDPDVTLTLNPGSVAATEMAVRNDEDAYGAWEAFAATKAWTLSTACKVWAKFRDSA